MGYITKVLAPYVIIFPSILFSHGKKKKSNMLCMVLLGFSLGIVGYWLEMDTYIIQMVHEFGRKLVIGKKKQLAF